MANFALKISTHSVMVYTTSKLTIIYNVQTDHYLILLQPGLLNYASKMPGVLKKGWSVTDEFL